MLNFERFRAINAAGLTFDLQLRKRGLVRMLGPNGAGKSTLWHMFTQTHYGASPNGAKKSDFQHEEKVKNFLLESTFVKNNATYTAVHAVKCKELSPEGKPYDTYDKEVFLFRDGKDLSKHKAPDTLNLIKDTMGWSLDEWYGYVYLAQATTHSLINGTRSTRQSYLSALFNLLPLDTLHKYCKGKSESYDDMLKELEKEKQEYAIKLGLLKDRSLSGSESTVTDLRSGVEFITQQLQGLERKQATFERRQTLEQQLAGKTRPEKPHEELTAEIERLQQQEAAFKSSLTRKQKLEMELAALPVALEPTTPADFDEILATPDHNEAALTQEIGQLEALEATIRNLQIVETPADFDEVLASPDLDEFVTRQRLKKLKERPAPPTVERPAQEKLNAQSEKINMLAMEIRDLEKSLKRLEFGEAECDKCGTQLDVQHREEERTQKREELEALQAAAVKARKVMTDLTTSSVAWIAYDALGPDETAEIPTLEASVERFKTKKTYQAIRISLAAYQTEQETKQKVARLPELRQVRDTYRKKTSYQKLGKQKETYARFIETKTRIEQDLSEIVLGVSVAADLGALQSSLRALNEIRQIETELEPIKEAKDVSAKISGLKSEQSDLQVKLGQMLREIEEVKQLTAEVERLGQTIEQKSHLSLAKTKYGLLTKGYGKAGQLRELQLKKFSNYLKEALLAHTIRQLPEHRFEIVVDDGIDIMTSKNGCTPYDVKFMSGGEKGALSLAFLFALDDLLPPDRRTNVKIVDEIEAAFDANRKLDFAQHTLPELRKRAETVIVISHAGAANQGSFDAYWEIQNGGIVENFPEKREYEEEAHA